MRDLDLIIQQTTHALLRLRGETAELSLASQFVKRFAALDSEGVDTFFTFLLEELGPDEEAVSRAIEAYQTTGEQTALADLADAAESNRLHLFRRINVAPGGISSLLSMRTALLNRRHHRPELGPIERDLSHLLRSWFNRGFLELRKLDWETPAHILEKLIEYEAVHEIQGWSDLQRRLAPDRRAFGFFHPSLPNEPIIFVEVALTTRMASSIQSLLDSEPEPVSEQTDCAMFYSITNCQSGLRGISFGSFLIKQVTAELQAELPQIHTFSTLSPIPGFAAWLENEVSEGSPIDIDDRAEVEAACARYLVGTRHKNLPVDAVARFHLRNGARVERLNWQGDVSDKGRRESHTMLVNYLYSGQDLEANHDALVLDGVIVASSSVISLADGAIDEGSVVESPSDVIF